MKRQRRKYQKVGLVAARKVRQIAYYWARRCRKSTTLGEIAFDEMSVQAGRTVVAASASLLLGRELVGMTLTATEQAMICAQEAAAIREVFEVGAGEKKLDFKVADSEKDKILTGLTADDFADLYRSSRMELRLYFDRTTYSRQQVIAPNPATARSWRATVLRDECGYTPPALEQELRDATDPMMRDVPELKMIYACNLSRDDRHPWFETTMPREISTGSEEEQFPANESGHLYIGQHGILVHRVALKDAYAAGHQLYDDRGEAMSYDEARQFPAVKSAWDISYALNHKSGGTAAIDLIALLTAQRRGVGQAAFIHISDDVNFSGDYSLAQEHEDFLRALHLLRELLTAGPVGIGFDVASTTGDTSNPSSITVTEKLGGWERCQRLTLVFKNKKRKIMSGRLREIIRVINQRPDGPPARRLCIDSSNERLAAEETKDDLCSIIPVELVAGGNIVEPRPAGFADDINYKTLTGENYSTQVNEGRYILAPDKYIKDDQRLPRKDQGRFVCTPEPDGKHGDTFDSGKLGEWALESNAGAIESVAGIVQAKPKFKPHFMPRRLVRPAAFQATAATSPEVPA